MGHESDEDVGSMLTNAFREITGGDPHIRIVSGRYAGSDKLSYVAVVCLAESGVALNALEAEVRGLLLEMGALHPTTGAGGAQDEFAYRQLPSPPARRLRRTALDDPTELLRAVTIFREVLRGATYRQAGERNGVSNKVAEQRFRLVRRLIAYCDQPAGSVLTARMERGIEPDTMRADADRWIELSTLLTEGME